MKAHLTERGLELEPEGHTERYAVRAFMSRPEEVKIFILGDHVDEKKTVETKAEVVTTSPNDPPPNNAGKKNERELVIEELTALGVAFDKKQGLAYLKKLLDKAKKPIDVPAPEPKVEAPVETAPVADVDAAAEDMFGEPTPPPVVKKDAGLKPPSKDEFRDMLKAYAQKNGMDAAIKLMQDAGGFTNTSQVPESMYLGILAKMKV